MNEHYFATHAMGWATALTREEAQQKLMQDTDPTWARNCLKSGSLLTVFSCKVPLPEDASYKIDWYVPKVDGVSDGQNHFVTYLTKTKHALMRDPSDKLKLRIKVLKARLQDTVDGWEGAESTCDSKLVDAIAEARLELSGKLES